MRHADLSLTVSQRKLACVLDPALVLGHAQGPLLAVRLTRVFEAWLTRSFWQVIDSSDCPALHASDPEAVRVRPDRQALAAWIAMRRNTDAGSWCLRWIGDSLASSHARDDAEPDLVVRWESLLRVLGRRSETDIYASTWPDGLDPFLGGLDTLALAATLEDALILSSIGADEYAPWPVQALERSHVRLHPTSGQTLFAEERRLVRDALASAGLAAVVERLPRLAIVRLMIDAPLQWTGELTDDASSAMSDDDPLPIAERIDEDEPVQTQQPLGNLPVASGSVTLSFWQKDPWETAHAWWYPV